MSKLTPEQREERIEYLKATDHLVVKWVHRFAHPGHGDFRYHRDTIPHMTTKLSEATVYDMRYFAPELTGYELVAVTKRELFKAKLAGT
jgi:hypothetical protein